MTKNARREYFARGKGILSATGPQSRFIVFLISLLVAYTFLLMIFRKLAAMVSLPLFLPIALVTLAVFIGIAGTLYSHRFVGPMARIRKTLDQLAEGESSVTLRLRESDDPMLKELVHAIERICDHTRQSHHLVRETARDLFSDVAALQERIGRDADGGVPALLDSIRKKQVLLEKAIASLGK